MEGTGRSILLNQLWAPGPIQVYALGAAEKLFPMPVPAAYASSSGWPYSQNTPPTNSTSGAKGSPGSVLASTLSR